MNELMMMMMMIVVAVVLAAVVAVAMAKNDAKKSIFSRFLFNLNF